MIEIKWSTVFTHLCQPKHRELLKQKDRLAAVSPKPIWCFDQGAARSPDGTRCVDLRCTTRVLTDCLELVAGHPAAVRSADPMLPSATHTDKALAQPERREERRSSPGRYSKLRRDHDRTTVVAVGATSTIRAAMETDAATASDWNDQTVLSLIAPKRHGLSGDSRQANKSRNKNICERFHLFSP